MEKLEKPKKHFLYCHMLKFIIEKVAYKQSNFVAFLDNQVSNLEISSSSIGNWCNGNVPNRDTNAKLIDYLKDYYGEKCENDEKFSKEDFIRDVNSELHRNGIIIDLNSLVSVECVISTVLCTIINDYRKKEVSIESREYILLKLLNECIQKKWKMLAVSEYVLDDYDEIKVNELIDNKIEYHIITNEIKNYDLTVAASAVIAKNVLGSISENKYKPKENGVKYVYYGKGMENDVNDLKKRVKLYLEKAEIVKKGLAVCIIKHYALKDKKFQELLSGENIDILKSWLKDPMEYSGNTEKLYNQINDLNQQFAENYICNKINSFKKILDLDFSKETLFSVSEKIKIFSFLNGKAAYSEGVIKEALNNIIYIELPNDVEPSYNFYLILKEYAGTINKKVGWYMTSDRSDDGNADKDNWLCMDFDEFFENISTFNQFFNVYRELIAFSQIREYELSLMAKELRFDI